MIETELDIDVIVFALRMRFVYEGEYMENCKKLTRRLF